MKLEKIKFRSETKNFYVEPAPENLGIRFMEYDEHGKKCVAMIVDNNNEFLLTSKYNDRMLIRPFMTTKRFLLKDGTEAPLEGEDQIEVKTPHGKKMIVRPISKDNKILSVIVAYEKNDSLWSIAICGAPVDGLLISLAK